MSITNLRNGLIVKKPFSISSDVEFLGFLLAAQEGDIAELQRFLESRPHDINHRDEHYGAAATHFAARNSQVAALQFLIDHHPILGTATNTSFNELHYGFASPEITSLIIQNRPDLINSPSEIGTALIIATYCQEFEVANILIENNADVTISNKDGNSALHCVADGELDNIEIALRLIEKGADINAVNHKENSVLATAIGSGNSEIAKLLLQQERIVIDDKARQNLEKQLEVQSENFFEIADLINQKDTPKTSVDSRAASRLAGEIIQALNSASSSSESPEPARKKMRVSPEISSAGRG